MILDVSRVSLLITKSKTRDRTKKEKYAFSRESSVTYLEIWRYVSSLAGDVAASPNFGICDTTRCLSDTTC
jgi:hypothetical protein